MIDIVNLRREFTLKTLDEGDIFADPIVLFEQWLKEAIESQALEPNAMALSTVNANCKPSCRIVLLKKLEKRGFVFFTNYNSRKGKEIEHNPNCALTFVWHELERQVRIEGWIEKLSPEDSDSYFEVRPTASKLGAWASPQSSKIPNREYLENLVLKFEADFDGRKINRPQNWGGYRVIPSFVEFWQGRENRLHDRISYTSIDKKWDINRLAP